MFLLNESKLGSQLVELYLQSLELLFFVLQSGMLLKWDWKCVFFSTYFVSLSCYECTLFCVEHLGVLLRLRVLANLCRTWGTCCLFYRNITGWLVQLSIHASVAYQLFLQAADLLFRRWQCAHLGAPRKAAAASWTGSNRFASSRGWVKSTFKKDNRKPNIHHIGTERLTGFVRRDMSCIQPTDNWCGRETEEDKGIQALQNLIWVVRRSSWSSSVP